ncbi:MAG: glutamate--tRNA ligase family protein [Kofleriaceae bacterium]|nr:glutamate--tRNA ligase family protein [Kofleriaceae bacterium]
MISRFAPSTTGEAHPGTLLSALLVWLDARARGGKALLRLEDLDTTRTKAVWAAQLVDACRDLGLDWDETIVQTARGPAHEAALDRLAASGRLYPCACSRADRTGGRRSPDGGWAYENTCRGRPLVGDWRAATEPLRARLDDDRVELVDDGGLELSQTPARDMGDPIVRRRDGVIAYQLAVVVDDADEGVTHVVRGRDIATSTATQVMLQRALGLPTPHYRHHFLLLEHQRGDKLAKLHGSIPYSTLRAHHDGPTLCGLLAHAAGQLPAPRPCTPNELISSFDWTRVPREDRVAVLAPTGLVIS